MRRLRLCGVKCCTRENLDQKIALAVSFGSRLIPSLVPGQDGLILRHFWQGQMETPEPYG